jgi:hypothetical protein
MDSELTAIYRMTAMDCGLTSVDCELTVMNCELTAMDCELIDMGTGVSWLLCIVN